MKIRDGQFVCLQHPLTHISVTRRGMSWIASILLSVGRRVLTLHMVGELQFIHFASWQRVRAKKLPRLAPDQPKEKFPYDFLLFTSNYNGDWDQYIDTFARVPHIRRGIRWLWKFSRGFPGPLPLTNFKQWIHYQTYGELQYYSAYPASTVRNVKAAIAVKKELQDFAATSPDKEAPAEFRGRYLGMLEKIAPNLGSAPGVSDFYIASSEPGRSETLEAAAYHASTGKHSDRRPLLGGLAGGGGVGQTVIAAMSPIEVKPAHTVTAEIAQLITEVATSNAPSPFAECPMLHMARLLIVNDVRPSLGSSVTASLRSNYLLFVAAIDGELDDFLDCLYAAGSPFVHGVWGRCLGYAEDQAGPVYFRRYIARSLLPVQLPYVAFPGQTALDIRGALRIHADMLEWMADHPCSSMSDNQLMTDWQNKMDQFRTGNTVAR